MVLLRRLFRCFATPFSSAVHHHRLIVAALVCRFLVYPLWYSEITALNDPESDLTSGRLVFSIGRLLDMGAELFALMAMQTLGLFYVGVVRGSLNPRSVWKVCRR